MIFADLHGKLSGLSRLDERREDVLTSTAFGLLRYVPEEEALLPLLRHTRRIELRNGEVVVGYGAHWLRFVGPRRCEVEFWPRLGRNGEPDLRIRCFGQDDALMEDLLVEVKYLSSKSGEADEEETYEPAVPDGDQLTRYWQVLDREEAAGVFTAVIYLTAHAAPPIEELGRSLRRCERVRLGWLSWRDVWAVSARIQSPPMQDLTRLLGHKGLKPFTGFSSDGVPPTSKQSLFASRRNRFHYETPMPFPTERLWRTK
jgi:hypothetical protein